MSVMQESPMAGRSRRRSSQIGTSWWAGEDSNLRRRRRQVYSLLPLSARAPTLEAVTIPPGAGNRAHTAAIPGPIGTVGA